MKSIIPYFLLLLFVVGLQACDKIEGPYKESGQFNNTSETRKVLLEDFTGHSCVNCPAAAKLAAELKEFYGENLIVIAAHAGYFAKPKSAPFEQDFRTEAGEAWESFFGISTAGYPKGLINRKSWSGSQIFDPGEWATKIDEIIQDEALVTIDVQSTYEASDRQLDIQINSTFTGAFTEVLKLQVLLVEDSIIGGQLNNDPTIGPELIPEYLHRHVLRQSINGIWGENLNQTSIDISSGSIIEKSYSVVLSDSFVSTRCSVIVYVYRESDLEILQVVEKHL